MVTAMPDAPGPVRDPAALLRGLNPQRQPGAWVFVTTPDPAGLAAQALATFREAEGVTLVLPLDLARAAGFDTTLPMAQITLQVWSALEAVGLTAAVAAALQAQAIPANVIAAYHHDHVFVPEPMADRALAALRALAATA
ncbi:MAG: ACT domain-containing protein [Paracoccaceae bacterium]|nr:MAG: ACT domain-containing protein [Paracoccaceae bacterium]